MITAFPFALSRWSDADDKWQPLSAHGFLNSAKAAARNVAGLHPSPLKFRIDNYSEGRTWTATYHPGLRMTWKEIL